MDLFKQSRKPSQRIKKLWPEIQAFLEKFTIGNKVFSWQIEAKFCVTAVDLRLLFAEKRAKPGPEPIGSDDDGYWWGREGHPGDLEPCLAQMKSRRNRLSIAISGLEQAQVNLAGGSPQRELL